METVVIHPGGGLGDSVLTWPLLRAVAAGGAAAVMADSRARLAARCLGVRAWPDHLPPWPGLWSGRGAPAYGGVGLVIVFGERPAAWLDVAAATFPAARVEVEVRTLDRRIALEVAELWGRGAPISPRQNPAGPVVLHVGAGSRAKQWPLECWWDLAVRLQQRGSAVRVIAGEAEADRWDAATLDGFRRRGGEVLGSLEELEDALRAARAVVAADTGAAHLAGQLGLPTLTLFGPTDPDSWSPIGPQVRTLRSPGSRMEDLPPDVVLGGVEGMLR